MKSLILSLLSQYGEFWVKAIAWDKPSFAADSFFVYVRGPVVTESLPAGLAGWDQLYRQ